MAVLRIATLQGLVMQTLAPKEYMKQSVYFARKKQIHQMTEDSRSDGEVHRTES